MNLSNKRFLVIGGGGLIGSHTVDELLKEEVKEVIIYDNFTRGTLAKRRRSSIKISFRVWIFILQNF